MPTTPSVETSVSPQAIDVLSIHAEQHLSHRRLVDVNALIEKVRQFFEENILQFGSLREDHLAFGLQRLEDADVQNFPGTIHPICCRKGRVNNMMRSWQEERLRVKNDEVLPIKGRDPDNNQIVFGVQEALLFRLEQLGFYRGADRSGHSCEAMPLLRVFMTDFGNSGALWRPEKNTVNNLMGLYLGRALCRLRILRTCEPRVPSNAVTNIVGISKPLFDAEENDLTPEACAVAIEQAKAFEGVRGILQPDVEGNPIFIAQNGTLWGK